VTTRYDDPAEESSTEDIEITEIPVLEEGLPETLVNYQPAERTIPEKQETIRGTLALIFASVFGAIILSPLVLIPVTALIAPTALIDIWAVTKEWLQLTLPAVTGIVGSALGFYFGTRDT